MRRRPPTCRVCARDDRYLIERRLAKGLSIYQVASEFGISRRYMNQHARHIEKAASKARARMVGVRVDDLPAELASIQESARELEVQAWTRGDLASVAAAVQKRMEAWELRAKACGVFAADGATLMGTVDSQKPVQDMSDAELDALVRRGKERLDNDHEYQEWLKTRGPRQPQVIDADAQKPGPKLLIEGDPDRKPN